MSLRVVVRSPAETDLLESALFIAEGNPAAAQRFLDEAEKAFARLAEFPEIGTPRTAFDPALAGLRLWPVPGFEKFRICYIPRADHIDVDLIKRLQAPYTVHQRSRDPFRIGVQLRVHAGLPLENLTDKPAVDVAAGDARQKSSRCHPFREGDFDGPVTSVPCCFCAGHGHSREAAPLDGGLLRVRLAGGQAG